jgi:soluble lytic murein transglycosylase-like protein
MRLCVGRIALLGAIWLCGFALPGQVAAQAASQGVGDGDFTFRRVSVPPAGTANRITVQITQRAPSAPSTPPSAGEAAALPAVASSATPAGTEWFWDTISPKLEDSAPGRLDLALRTMEAAPGGAVNPPRLQTMQDIARVHGQDILRATIDTRVSPALALAVIAVESAGQGDAVSRSGAQGLMQLMPDTAARFGVTDSMVTADNIRGGVAYLDWLMQHFDNDPILVLAGYNAGEGSVRDNAGVPPFAETRAYVPKVLAAWAVARGLCQTPPELVSDGCVFAVNNL